MAIDFGIWTWGSCRYSDVEVLYPEKLNLKRFTERRGSGEVDLGFMKFTYTNNDSNKNYDRKIEITEVRQPVVIRNHGNSSCSKSFDNIYLITPDLQMKELPIKSEVKRGVPSPNGKYLRDIEVQYVEVDGKKIILNENVISENPIYSSMKVYVEVKGNNLIVRGDTYGIKGTLKELGLKWNPTEKVWYTTANRFNEVIEGLKKTGVSIVITDETNEQTLKQFLDFITKDEEEDRHAQFNVPAILLEDVLSSQQFVKFYSSGNESAYLKGNTVVLLKSDGAKTDVDVFEGVYTAEHPGKVYEIIVLRNPDTVQYYAVYPLYNPGDAIIVENEDEGMGVSIPASDVQSLDMFIRMLPVEAKNATIVPFPVPDFFNLDKFLETRKKLGFKGFVSLILSDETLEKHKEFQKLRKFYSEEKTEKLEA